MARQFYDKNEQLYFFDGLDFRELDVKCLRFIKEALIKTTNYYALTKEDIDKILAIVSGGEYSGDIAKQTTLVKGLKDLSNKLDTIHVDVDVSTLAKQGSDDTASLTTLKEALQNIDIKIGNVNALLDTI